jgi:hypothetical protein
VGVKPPLTPPVGGEQKCSECLFEKYYFLEGYKIKKKELFKQ